MAKLDSNPYLLAHLESGQPFLYAHLVKFERPYRLSNIVQENSNIQFSTKFTKYAYVTDASFNISFDDGSTYLTSVSASANNGAQLYRANKLKSIGPVSESADTKISNMTITLNANSVDASLPTQSIVFNSTGDTITAVDSFSDAGFQEGDLVVFKASSGNNRNKTFRINYFTNSGKTIYVTEDSDTVTTETANYSAVLASSEINALMNTTNSVSFINRKVSVYKIFFSPDTPEVLIGTPILIFNGIISSAKYDEDPDKGAEMQWTLSSHWGDFQQVRGRLGVDEFHRALTTEGTPDPNGTLKPEYAMDKGFQHANTAVNVVGIYKVMETRYKIKKKKKSFFDPAGLFRKSKLKAYQVEVDKEVDLRFNLSAKYIPIVYGVRRVEGVPVFADTAFDSPSEVYMAEVLCEGPIQGVLNIFVDDNPLICTDLADYNVRNSSGTSYNADSVDVACFGRADRGDVLSGSSSTAAGNIANSTSSLATGANGGSWDAGTNAFHDNTANIGNIRISEGSIHYPNVVDTSTTTLNLADLSTATTTSGTGLTHEKGYTIAAPVSATVEIKTGTESQKASSLLVDQSSTGGFKIQKDYYGNTSYENYWGPNHRLLDTAYVAQKVTIGAEQTTVPDFQYVVKGKLVKCYNYDGSFAKDPTRTSAAESLFNLGATVSIKDSVSLATLASSVVIIDKWSFYGANGSLNYRFRWDLTASQERALLNAKAFYMESGANKWYMITHDYSVGTFNVTTQLRQAVTATANNGGALQVTTAGAVSTISQWSDSSVSLTGKIAASNSADIPNLGVTNFYVPVGSIFTASPQSNTLITLSGSTTASSSITSMVASGDLYLEVNNKIVLSAGASGSNDAYNGMTAKITKFLADGTTDIIYRDIVDYEVSTNKVITVSPILQPQQIPGSSDKVEILLDMNGQDYRPTTNFAMMTLDFLTTKRGGAGLDLTQLDLNTFLQAARICDTTSDVTVRLNGTASVGLGDIYHYTSTSFKWRGTVKKSSNIGSDTFITFTDCIGKLTNKFNNWSTRAIGDVIWDDSTNSVYRVTTGGVQTSISTNATLLTAGTFTLAKTTGTGPATVSLRIDAGNPVTDYSLYDSDFVKYWKYLGWDSQDQRWVTVHQGNIEIDTSAPVYNNITDLLSHFNGILTFENGKYALYVETKRDSDTDLWWNFQDSTEGWLTSGINVTTTEEYISLNSIGSHYIEKTGLSFYGYDNQIVQMKIRRVSGSGWTGRLEYVSSGNSYGSNTVTIADTTTLGEWATLTWNMAPRTQWTGEYVTSIKIYLGTSLSDDFDIEWISIGSNTRVIEPEDIIGSVVINDDGVSGSYNSLTANIVDPHNNFNTRSVSFFNSTYLAEDRGVVRSTNFSLEGITNYYNARLSVEQVLRRSRYGRTIAFSMRPVGLGLTPGDLIRIIYPRFGWYPGKYFRVNSLTFNPDCLVNVTAEEYNDSIYFIEPGKKSPYSIDVPPKREPITPPAPTNLVATSFSNIPSDEEVGLIRLSWTAPAGLAESASFEIFGSTTLGGLQTPGDSSAVKLGTVPYDVTQFIDYDIQGTARITKYYWVRTANKVSVQTTDSLDLRDYYSDYTTYAAGTSVSAEDDQAVGNSLGGSLLANPMFNAATLKYDGTEYRPIGWYIRGTSESEIAYSNANRDTVKFTQDAAATATLEVISHAIQLANSTSYDLAIVARRVGAVDQTVSVYSMEHTAQLNTGKYSLTNTAPTATYIDPDIQESTGTALSLGNITLTSAFQLFSFSFRPQATSVIGAIKFVLDNNEGIEIDSIWLRSSGARTGTNLFDDLNTLLRGIDIRNDQLVKQNLQFVNPNASFDIPRYDGGAVTYPTAGTYVLRPAAWYLSSSNADNLKPTYKDSLRDEAVFAAGSTVAGAAIRVNPDTYYEFVALVRTDHASTAATIGLAVNEYISDIGQGTKFIANTSPTETGGQIYTRAITIVASQSVGTTYTLLSGTYNPGASSPVAKWFSPTMVIGAGQAARVDWFGVRDKSTYGARAGTSLFDSTGAILSDLDIENDAILGTVLGGSLLGNPTLDFAFPKIGNPDLPRPVGIFLAGNSESEISYPNAETRDSVLITRSGANVLYVLSQFFYIDPTDQYELVIVAKSSVNNTVIDVRMMENSSPITTAGKAAMTSATLVGYGFVDSEVLASTGTATSLGTITLTTGYTAFTKTFTPLPTSRVGNLVLEFGTNGESMEIESLWLRSRNSVTAATVEGSIISNPTFQQARIGSTGILRPLGWFIKGTAESEISYSNAARSSVRFIQDAAAVANLEVLSHSFRVNTATKYNITIVAKASSGTPTIDIAMIEHNAEFTDGTLSFTPSAAIALEFKDPEVKVATGTVTASVLSVNSIALTASYQAFNLVYTPSSTAVLACFRFLVNDTENIEISSMWVRDASTLGATTGSSGNLRDEIGNYLRGIDVRNDQLVRQGLEFYNPNASFDLTRYDGGANVYPAGSPALYTTRPAHWYQANSTSVKPSYLVTSPVSYDIVEVGANSVMAGTALRVNSDTRYEFVALVRKPTVGTSNVRLRVYEYNSDFTTTGMKFIGEATGETGVLTNSQFVNLGTADAGISNSWTIIRETYIPSSTTNPKWFSPAISSSQLIEVDWYGVVEKSTFGAEVGTNLFDSADRILYDVDIKNDRLVRRALGFINENSGFDFVRDTGAVPFVPRPAAWYCSNSTLDAAKPTYLDPTVRDEIVLPNGSVLTSHAIRVNPGDRYELSALVRSSSATTTTITFHVEEYTGDMGSPPFLYVGQAGGETGRITGVRFPVTTTVPGAIGNTWTLISSSSLYNPSGSSPQPKWISISLTTSGNSAVIDWFGIRSGSTYGAKAGVNGTLFDSAGNLLLDIDIENDQVVGSILGSSLTSNPSMDFARLSETAPSFLRPVGWFLRAAAETQIAYTVTTPPSRDSVTLTGSAILCSVAFPVNVDSRYEVIVIASKPSALATSVVNVNVAEHTSRLTAGKLSFTNATATTYNDPELETGIGTATTIGSMNLTNSMAYYVYEYIPTAVGKIMACINIVADTGETIIIDQIWVRDKATFGAKTGTSLFDANGSPLQESDIVNDVLIGDILGASILGNPSLDMARTKDTTDVTNPIRPIGWYRYAFFETDISYVDNNTRDIVRLTNSVATNTGIFLSAPFRLNLKTTYELTVIARTGTTITQKQPNMTVTLFHTASAHPLTTGITTTPFATFIPSAAASVGFQDTSVKNSEGIALDVTTFTSLTTSFQAFTTTITPPSGAVWGAIGIKYVTNASYPAPQILEIDSVWLREKTTEGATVGSSPEGGNLYTPARQLLSGVDIRNDELVTKALGFLNENSGFSFPRADGTFTWPSGGDFKIRPAGWYCSNSSTSANKPVYLADISYTPWVYGDTDYLDEVYVPAAQVMTSHAIRVNPDTKYELSALVRTYTGTASISFYVEEYSGDLSAVTGGTKDLYIGQAGGEAGLRVRTGYQLINTVNSVTTTYTQYNGSIYTPTSGTKWISISVHCATQPIVLDWFGIRSASTWGATTNVNIKGEVFTREDFGAANLTNVLNLFSEIVTTGSDMLMVSTTTPVGGYAWRCGNNLSSDQMWRGVDRRKAMPVLLNKLYRVSFWMRRNAGTGVYYLGVNGFKGDVYNGGGAAVNSVGNNTLGTGQFYFAAYGVSPGTTNWVYYEAYFKKDGIAYSDSPTGTLYDPKILHQDVEYVAPLIIVNYPGVAGEVDIGYVELIEVDNGPTDVVTVGGDTVAAFNVDGSANYQPKRTSAWYYTYDAGGIYKYYNGSDNPPWLESKVTFYKGKTELSTLSFIHMCNYGREDLVATRIGSIASRSYWRSNSGPAASSDFTVTIGGVSKSMWNAAQYLFGGNNYDIILSSHYGGSAPTYDIEITHVPSGIKGILTVTGVGIVGAGAIDVGKS